MKSYKPLLAPNNEVNLNEINYPLLASTKLDGIRVIFYKGQILTRSLKKLLNKQLNIKFEALRKYSEDYNLILDGEIYSHELTFQEIISFCMTQDFEDKKSIKKYGEIKQIPKSLKFYCFDAIRNDEFDKDFSLRYAENVLKVERAFPRLAISVFHKQVKNEQEVENYFEEVLKEDYEGLILRSLNGRYKCGRGTLKEGIIYKVKKFRTVDAKILDIVQATEVNPDVEKKTNELGRSCTSHKKNDRHLIEKASAFVVDYHGQNLKVTLSMTDVAKKHVWNNQNEYINKWVEYKYMAIGMKEGGLPRHPTTIRMRLDKDN